MPTLKVIQTRKKGGDGTRGRDGGGEEEQMLGRHERSFRNGEFSVGLGRLEKSQGSRIF